jgi:hypothetical protein
MEQKHARAAQNIVRQIQLYSNNFNEQFLLTTGQRLLLLKGKWQRPGYASCVHLWIYNCNKYEIPNSNMHNNYMDY